MSVPFARKVDRQQSGRQRQRPKRTGRAFRLQPSIARFQIVTADNLTTPELGHGRPRVVRWLGIYAKCVKRWRSPSAWPRCSSAMGRRRIAANIDVLLSPALWICHATKAACFVVLLACGHACIEAMQWSTGVIPLAIFSSAGDARMGSGCSPWRLGARRLRR